MMTSTARNISLCCWEKKKKKKKKPLLEANIKMELINFYPPAGKIFISGQFANMFMSMVLFSPSFELCITMYHGKFALSRIPSHHIITCFLAHCLGNFSIKSLNQISCLLSLNTFQDSRDNKCQSIKTVFSSLKIKLSSAA